MKKKENIKQKNQQENQQKKKKEDVRLKRKLEELGPNWRGGVGLYVPIFGCHIRLLVGSDEDAVLMVRRAGETMRKLAQPTISSRDPNVPGLVRCLGDEAVIRMRRMWLESDIDVAVLYHECLHIVVHILATKQIVPDSHGEITAWLLDYIGLGLISRMRSGEFFTIKPDGSKSQPLNRPIISQCSLAGHETYVGK